MFRASINLVRRVPRLNDGRSVHVLLQLPRRRHPFSNSVPRSIETYFAGFANDAKSPIANTKLAKKPYEILHDLITEEDFPQEFEQHMRPKLRVSDILSTMEPKKFTIDDNVTMIEAIDHLMNEKLASTLTMNSKGEISGIVTARDLLHFIRGCITQQKEGRVKLYESLGETKVKKIITPKDQLVYCSPSDSVKRCREIMFQCKVRNLPVIIDGAVKGIITAKLLADASFNLMDTGGKKGYIHNVTGRKGLPEGTKFDQSVVMRSKSHAAGEISPFSSEALQLDVELGSFALPHPFKRPDGVAMNHRQYGAYEFSEDMSVCEDAHFAIKLPDPLAAVAGTTAVDHVSSSATEGNDIATAVTGAGVATAGSHLVYMCVADGVGSWRQYDVDPKAYSHRLVEHARKVIESDVQHRELLGHSPFDRDLDPIHPLDVIMDAWNLASNDGVVGSSTICVATVDKKLNQLSYSNLGDCGLMVIRHIDSETAGYMRERKMPRHLRKSDLRIAYLSQQQLRSFNLPYQLGFSDIPNTPNSFETPTDSDTASIPIIPGDIIILATDGLFDNLDLDEIVEEVSDWEHEFRTTAAATVATTATGSSLPSVQSLAERLVRKARALSLDKERDSPFALLAKENDIMWGGGMPDDTSVVVGRVRNAVVDKQ